MTATIEKIHACLQSLAPSLIVIDDESARHARHMDAEMGGGHYNLHIVSERFAGKNAIMRHRMVHAALGNMMKGEIHAIAIHAQTAAEADQPTKKDYQ
jgi:BolA protein